jgi:hypothetical protein
MNLVITRNDFNLSVRNSVCNNFVTKILEFYNIPYYYDYEASSVYTTIYIIIEKYILVITGWDDIDNIYIDKQNITSPSAQLFHLLQNNNVKIHSYVDNYNYHKNLVFEYSNYTSVITLTNKKNIQYFAILDNNDTTEHEVVKELYDDILAKKTCTGGGCSTIGSIKKNYSKIQNDIFKGHENICDIYIDNIYDSNDVRNAINLFITSLINNNIISCCEKKIIIKID